MSVLLGYGRSVLLSSSSAQNLMKAVEAGSKSLVYMLKSNYMRYTFDLGALISNITSFKRSSNCDPDETM